MPAPRPDEDALKWAGWFGTGSILTGVLLLVTLALLAGCASPPPQPPMDWGAVAQGVKKVQGR